MGAGALWPRLRVKHEDVLMSAFFTARFLARAGLAILCLKIAVAVLLNDSSAFLAFSHVKALAGYSLSLFLLGLLAALFIQGGRSVLTWTPLHVPAALFALAYLLAAAFAVDQRIALAGAVGRYLGLLTVLDSLVMYAAAATLLPLVGGGVRWVALTIASTAAVELGIEVLQIVGIMHASGSGRPYGTAGNADPLGVLMATFAAGAIGAAAAPSSSRHVRVGALGVAAVALAGWLLSGTRAPVPGLAATILGLAVLWALAANRTGARVKRAAVLGALGVAVLAAVAVSPMGQRLVRIAGSAGPLLAGSLDGVDKNVAGRLDHYRASLSMFLDRPLLGIGPDNYVVRWADYRLPDTRQFHRSYGVQTSTHGWPFKLVTDAGIAGLTALVGVLVVGAGTARRHWRDPWILGSLAMLMTILGGAAVAPSSVVLEWIPWVALGVIGASAAVPVVAAATDRTAHAEPATERKAGRSERRPPQRGRKGASRRSPGFPVAAAIAVAAGLALALTPLAAWGASRDAAQARAALRAGSNDRAVAFANRSVQGDAWQASYWTQLGGAQRRAGKEPAALQAFQRAADLAPWDAATWLNVGQSQILLYAGGDKAQKAAALETMRRAVAVDPYRPDVHHGLAVALYNVDRYEDAAAEAETGYAIDQDSVAEYGYEVAARSYLKLERPEQAERWCELGLADPRLSQGRQITLRLLSAQALLALGRSAEALAQVDKVLALDASNAQAKQLKKTIQGR